jgi:hypothetical protein
MPRRVPDYPDAFYAYNKIASWGSYISAWSALVFFFVLHESLTRNRRSLLTLICDKYIMVVRSILVYRTIPKMFFRTVIPASFIFTKLYFGWNFVLLIVIPIIILVVSYAILILPAYLALYYPETIGLRVSQFMERNCSWVFFEGFGTIFYERVTQSKKHLKKSSGKSKKRALINTQRSMFTLAKRSMFTKTASAIVAENVSNALSKSAQPIYNALCAQTSAVEKLIAAKMQVNSSSDYFEDWNELVNVTSQNLQESGKLNNELVKLSNQMKNLALQNPELNPDNSLDDHSNYLTVTDCSILKTSVEMLGGRLYDLATVMEDTATQVDQAPIDAIKNVLSYVRIIDSINAEYSTGIITQDAHDKTCRDSILRMCNDVDNLTKMSSESIATLSEINSNDTLSVPPDLVSAAGNVEFSLDKGSKISGNAMGFTYDLERAFKINLKSISSIGLTVGVMTILCTAGISTGVYLFSKGLLFLNNIDPAVLKEILGSANEAATTTNTNIEEIIKDPVPEQIDVDPNAVEKTSPLK